MKRHRIDRQSAGLWFSLPSIIIMFGLILYPLLYGLYISVFKTNLLTNWEFVGLSNYFRTLSNVEFYESVWITFKFSGLVVIGSFIIGLFLAIFLNMQIKGQALFRVILVLPWLFPEVVVALIWKWLFNPVYGLINHMLLSLNLISQPLDILGSPNIALYGVVLATLWKAYPMVMVLMLAGLQSIPNDLYEAADIDGGNFWHKIRYIMIPGLKPVILISLILNTVWWFKHFTIIHLLTAGGPGTVTNVVSIDIYHQAFGQFNFGQGSATAVLVFIICLAISYIYRRLMDNDV